MKDGKRPDIQKWLPICKRRLSSLLAVIITVSMIFNVPIAWTVPEFDLSNVYASGSDAGKGHGGSIWATASNAQYKKGQEQKADLYVIAEDNEVWPGSTTAMTLYLKNNTDEVITHGILTFKGNHIQKEDGFFTDLHDGEPEKMPLMINRRTYEASEVTSGEGLIYQEETPEGETAELQEPGHAEPVDTEDSNEEDNQKDEEREAAEWEAEFGSPEDEEYIDEEEQHILTDIELQPGELYEVGFTFYTQDDEDQSKAYVRFRFEGEGARSETKVRSEEKFYYSIGLPYINLDLTDGLQLETGISHEMNIWMAEPAWTDMPDSEAAEASPSGAVKTGSRSDAEMQQADSDQDEITIAEYTGKAMEIEESRVSYQIEIFGAEWKKFRLQKAEEAEEAGWIHCIYELADDVRPGIYYGKATASGKWRRKAFTTSQGFLFEVTGEGKILLEGTLNETNVQVFGPESSFPEAEKLELEVKDLSDEERAIVETSLKPFAAAGQSEEQQLKQPVQPYATVHLNLIADGQEAELRGPVTVRLKNNVIAENVKKALEQKEETDVLPEAAEKEISEQVISKGPGAVYAVLRGEKVLPQNRISETGSLIATDAGAAKSADRDEAGKIEEDPAVADSEQAGLTLLKIDSAYAQTEHTDSQVTKQGALQAETDTIPAAYVLMDADVPAGETASDKYDLGKYITTIKIQRREKGTELWEDIVDNNVKVNDELRFEVNYRLPEGTLDSNNRTVTYQIDKKIKIIKADSGDVLNEGKIVGSYTIGMDGRIEIIFNEDYAKGNADGSPITGHVYFESSVEAMGGSEGGEIIIPFKEEVTLHVKNTVGDLTVDKESYNVKPTEGTLEYKIVVSSKHGTGQDVILEDVLEHAKIDGDISVVDKAGKKVNWTKREDGKYVLPQMSEESQYIITYKAKVSPELTANNSVVAKNTVKVSSTNSMNQPVEDEDDTEDKFTRQMITKTGKLDDSETTIDWQIRINYNSTSRMDISGWTLSDQLDDKDYKGTVTITPDPATGTGSITAKLPYRFPEGSQKVEYKVTYQTQGDETTRNQAFLTPPLGEGVGTGEIGPIGFGLTKKGTGSTLVEKNENGDLIVEQNWEITLDASRSPIEPLYCRDVDWWLAGVCVNSKENKEKVMPNGGFWILQDYFASGTTNVYYTAKQLKANGASIANAIDQSGYEGNYYIFASQNWMDYETTCLLHRNAGSSEIWDKNCKREPLSTAKYQQIFVYFDSAFQSEEPLVLHYSIMQNVGDGSKNVTNRNYVNVDNGISNVTASADQTYAPTILKYDYRKNNVNATSTTKYQYGDLNWTQDNREFENVLRWGIQIMLPDQEYTSDVVITEELPEGLAFLTDQKFQNDGEAHKAYVHFDGNPNVYGSWWLYLKLWKNPYDEPHGDQTVQIQIGDDGTGTVTHNDRSIHYIFFGDSKLEITIPPETANAIKGTAATMLVNAQIKDDANWDGIAHDFTNTVNITYQDKTLGEASQTQQVKRSVISKTCDKDKIKDNKIPYSLDINSAGADLVKNVDTLTVTDVLSYQLPEDSNIRASLDLDAITVRKITPDGFSEDITKECKVQIAEDTLQTGQVTHTITMTVPDSTHLKIDYSYNMSGKGVLEEVTNTATVEGSGSESDSSETKTKITVQESGAGATLEGINIQKVDGSNVLIHLTGAEFKLEKWDGFKWVQVTGPKEETGLYVTNEEGKFNTGKLAANTAYRLTETKAPEGYDLNRAVVYEFYIRGDQSEDVPVLEPAGFNGTALNSGDSVTIQNYPMGCELPETGGTGTDRYHRAGTAMMLSALIMLAGYTLEQQKRKNTGQGGRRKVS